VVTHANLTLGAMYTASLWATTPDDVYMVTTPIAHRTGLSRLMSCCAIGATVVMMPRFDAKHAVELIERNGVTILGCVPTVARILLDYLDKTDHHCPTLRLLLATGEAFPIALKRRLKARLPKVGLYSFYALTEAGVPAALGPEDQDAKPGSCGRPMPGMEIRLLDPEGREAPAGESGEIAVRWGARGRGMVILEYFNRPDANASSFDGDWFKTGDIGRFDDDGFLYLVDRAKDMIISGGFNIYPSDLEAVLRRHPAVADVSVIGVPSEQWGETPVACVVLREGAGVAAGTEAQASAATEEIQRWANAQLGKTQRLAAVKLLPELPRSAIGKVLKRELRERFGT
jgi:long-chain acyl-CoA synthetase